MLESAFEPALLGSRNAMVHINLDASWHFSLTDQRKSTRSACVKYVCILALPTVSRELKIFKRKGHTSLASFPLVALLSLSVFRP